MSTLTSRNSNFWGGLSGLRRAISPPRRRGGALLAVLWLSVALSAIVFALAAKVRSESERASTLADGIRAHYLATGAIERALIWCAYAAGPDRKQFPYSLYNPRMRLAFPTGEAMVELIPETARLGLNVGKPAEFVNLLLVLGVEPPRAQAIAAGILDWRELGGAMDAQYLSLVPSFRPRHASFQDVEEVLLVRGMTPDIFHGTYARDPQGRLRRLGALKDCVSVIGASGSFDVNHSEPALLRSLGMAPFAVDRLVQLRRAQPIVTPEALAQARAIAGPAGERLRYYGGSIFTLRATARLRSSDGRFSDLSRTVAAQVKFLPGGGFDRDWHILRWDDTAISEIAQW